MKLTLASLEGTPNNHHRPWESANNCFVLLPLSENKTRQICFVLFSTVQKYYMFWKLVLAEAFP